MLMDFHWRPNIVAFNGDHFVGDKGLSPSLHLPSEAFLFFVLDIE